MLEVIFWISVALIAYNYLGFPLLLYTRSRLFHRPPQCADITPHVTLLIVAHNEAGVIGKRLENALAMDYPRDRLTVLVASDGSDDGTDEIVARYSPQGIRLLSFPRGGKIATLNAAVAHAEGEILAFSDENSMCTPDALRMLVRAFADPEVGGVAGYQRYVPAHTPNTAAFGESKYSDVDQLWKQWQSAAGSVTHATGALYAIRRELFEPVPLITGDDIVISLRVIARGYRFVYEPRAMAVEAVAPSAEGEYRRKVRLCMFGFTSIVACRELLNPMRYGFYSLQLFSHKVLRYLLVWPLMALFVTSVLLFHTAPVYQAAFAVQAVFYGLATILSFVPDPVLRRLSIPRVLTLPYYFCMAYAGSLQAQVNVLLGYRWDSWTPRDGRKLGTIAPRAERAAQPKPTAQPRAVAYIMSRFPKITETFVMYEILEHEKRGQAIAIYPLMRERQRVAHPDAARLVESAHYMSFLSPAIVAANWHYLWHRPKAYFGVIAEALGGTFGSANFFLGALLFLPKSVAFARKMERSGVTHVHAHFATHAALSAFIVHRLTGIPFSFTVHAHDVQCDRRMLRQKLEAASFAVAISEYNRELMVEECGESLRGKIHVIHCGADTEFFQPAAIVPPPEPLRLICVASLNPMKGHRDLVEACRLLRERGVAFHCDLIGEGELRAEVEAQIASAGLQSAFTVHGARPREVVRQLFHQAHVKVLACMTAPGGVRDGIPVAMMEAMACGLPVVSTVISGVPELVTDGVTGFLVTPHDTASLADALARLAGDPSLLARMGKAGREKVLRDFDLSANAEALWRLFAHSAEYEPTQLIRATA
jgi:colanic acid/amylovoran biosynthesis glycosyltransferase